MQYFNLANLSKPLSLVLVALFFIFSFVSLPPSTVNAATIDTQSVFVDSLDSNSNNYAPDGSFVATASYPLTQFAVYVGYGDAVNGDRTNVTLIDQTTSSIVCETTYQTGITGNTVQYLVIDMTATGYGSCSVTSGDVYIWQLDARNSALTISRGAGAGDGVANGGWTLLGDSTLDSSGGAAFGYQPFFAAGGTGGVTPPIPPAPFYAQIQNTGSGAFNLREGTSTSADIIKTLPEDWIVDVASTTDDTGNPIINDGYQWYQVTDPTDNVTGWMAGADASNTVQYLPYDSSEQAGFEATSTDYVATSSRPDLILAAIDNYYNNASTTYSLYNGKDGANDTSLLSQGTYPYPEEIIPGMIVYEDGASIGGYSLGFNNENVSSDYGHGIMQVTFSPGAGWDHRGIASNVTIPPCQSTDSSTLYENCYTSVSGTAPYLRSYQPYAASSSNPTYKQYSNTLQSIYANIKDGMQVLSNAFGTYAYITTSTTTDGTTFNASDRKAISATADYNGSCSYVDTVADYLDNITSYFPDATTSEITDLIPKMHVAMDSTVCAKLHSPADISIEDSKGRVVGVVNGEGEDSFPLAIYNKAEKFAEILAADGNNYSFKVQGTGTGTYELDIVMKHNGVPADFKATGIPVTPGQIHTYVVDVPALMQGKNNAVTVQIDTKGNGTVNKTIMTGNTFTAAQFSGSNSTTANPVNYRP